MNILFVSHHFIKNSKGGTETLTLDLANLFLKKGHKIWWLAVGEQKEKFSFSQYYDIPCIEISKGFDIHYPSNWKIQEQIQAKKINDALGQLGVYFDIIHIMHFAGIGLEFVKSPYLERSKIVMTLTDYSVVCHDYQLFQFKKRKICSEPFDAQRCKRCTDKQVTSSDLITWRNRNIEFLNTVPFKIYTQTPYQKQLLVHNNISKEKFSELTACYGILDSWKERTVFDFKKIHFGFIGRISVEKGLDIVLKAFHAIPNENIVFEIYGELDLLSDYSRVIKQMMENDLRVIYHPPIELDRLWEAYHTIDCLLIPSVWLENHPVVLEYACVYQLKVLCSQVPSLMHLKNRKINFIENYQSPQAWKRGMMEVIHEKKEKQVFLGKKYREKFENYGNKILIDYETNL